MRKILNQKKNMKSTYKTKILNQKENMYKKDMRKIIFLLQNCIAWWDHLMTKLICVVHVINNFLEMICQEVFNKMILDRTPDELKD